jgi:hypothetical protein
MFIWDIDLPERKKTNKQFFCVHLRYREGKYEKETGYTAWWPEVSHHEAFYIQLAREVGLNNLTIERIAHMIFLEFIKPECTNEGRWWNFESIHICR